MPTAVKPNHRRRRVEAETSGLFPQRRARRCSPRPRIAAGEEEEEEEEDGEGLGRGGRSNSPMWMIESESADFHSWLQKTAASNKTLITFMLSTRRCFPPKFKRNTSTHVHTHAHAQLCESEPTRLPPPPKIKN